jgi:hypothetical protein
MSTRDVAIVLSQIQARYLNYKGRVIKTQAVTAMYIQQVVKNYNMKLSLCEIFRYYPKLSLAQDERDSEMNSLERLKVQVFRPFLQGDSYTICATVLPRKVTAMIDQTRIMALRIKDFLYAILTGV